METYIILKKIIKLFPKNLHSTKKSSNFALAIGKQTKHLESLPKNAKIAQLVEHDLAKVGVAGSSPVFRSEYNDFLVCIA